MAKWSGYVRRVKTHQAAKLGEARYASGGKERASAAQEKRRRRAERNLRIAAAGGMGAVE